MKQIFWSALIFCISAALGHAATFQELQTVLDTQTSLEDLSRLLEDPAYDPTADGRLLLLDGTVASVTIIDESAELFEVIVEIAVGRWTDSEEIELFRGYAAFFDPAFAPLFGIGEGSDSVNEIEIGQQLLLIAAPLTTILDPVDESEVLFFEAHYARPIR